MIPVTISIPFDSKVNSGFKNPFGSTTFVKFLINSKAPLLHTPTDE